ncbi:MAG: hypothetical protein KF752_07935 [Pirellulaceae bacterium]|nr:hypothetical protein [Pirellulaceae bacterium]
MRSTKLEAPAFPALPAYLVPNRVHLKMLNQCLKNSLNLALLGLLLFPTVIAAQEEQDITSLAHPEVAERLSLTDQQRAEVQKILLERANEIAAAADAKAADSVKREFDSRLQKLLTAQQLERWQQSRPAEKLMFQFRDMKWDQVLNWFASQQDLTLVMDRTPPGSFTYSDTRAYSAAEALDLLNSVLMTRGFTLVRRERMLTLMELGDGLPIELLPKIRLEQLPERGKFELVTVDFSLDGRPIDSVLAEVKPYLSSYGRVLPLARGSHLLVIEHAGKMQMINELISSVPVAKSPDRPPAPPSPVFASYSIGNLEASQTLTVLRQLIPSEHLSVDQRTAVLSAFVVPDQHVAIKRALDTMQEKQSELPALQSVVYPLTSMTAAEFRTQVAILAPNVKVLTTSQRGLIVAMPSEHGLIQEGLAALGIHPEQVEQDTRSFEVAAADVASLDTALRSFLPAGRVIANPQGSLIVRGSAAELASAEEIVQAWKRSTEKRQLRLQVWSLQRPADSEWLATTSQLVPGGKLWLAQEATRLLMLGSEEDIRTVESSLPALNELLPESSERKLHIYSLTKQQMLRRSTLGRLPKELSGMTVADGGQASELFVWGTAKEHAAFADYLQQLDQSPPPAQVRSPHVYPLAMHDTATAMQLLTAEFPAAGFNLSPTGRQLVCVAEEELHERIRARVEQMNQQLPPREEAVLETYDVPGMTAVALQQALTSATATSTVQLDVQRERLLIWATPDIHERIAAMVKTLSERPDADRQKIVVVYPLTSALASNVKLVLDQLGLSATVVADDKLRQLAVTGTIADHGILQSVIAQIDRQSATSPQPLVRSYDVKSFQAAQLLTTLQPLWPNLKMSVDSTANRLIASGSSAELDQVGKSLEQLLHTPAATPDIIRTYAVPQGEMNSLPATLKQIAPHATISSDPLSRTVTVAADESQHARVRQALEQLTLAASSSKQATTYSVKPSQLTAVQNTLLSLFPGISLAGDATTGQVIVVAGQPIHQEIGKVVEMLATGAGGAERTVQAFPLDEHRSEAASFLATLQTLVPSPVRLSLSPQSGAILAVGTPEELAEIARQVDSLKQQLPAGELPQPSVFKLQHANTATTLAMLQALFPKATLAQDATTQTIAVTATPMDRQKIEEFLKLFDTPRENGQIYQVYRVESGGGTALASALTALFPDARFFPDREGNAVLAVATHIQHARIQPMIDQLAKAAPPSSTRVFPLQRGNAQSLRAAVLEWNRNVKVSADVASNTLIVSATDDELKRIEQIVADVDGSASDQQVTRFYVLQSANPTVLAGALQVNFPKATVAGDTTSGGVFVTASLEQHEQIRALVEQLNEQPGRLAALRTFIVEHVPPPAVAKALTETLGRRGTASVSFNEDTQSVFVVGMREDLKMAEELVRMVDVPGQNREPRQLQVFSVDGLDGRSVMESLEAVFRDDPQRLEMRHDYTAGRLYVFGNEHQLSRAEQVIKSLAPLPRTLQVIALGDLDPIVTKEAVDTLFTDTPYSRTPLVTVDADQQRLLIKATEAQHEQIRSLLRQMTGAATANDDRGPAAGPMETGHSHVRVLPMPRGSQRILEQLQQIWPTLRTNPLRIVSPETLSAPASDEGAAFQGLDGNLQVAAKDALHQIHRKMDTAKVRSSTIRLVNTIQESEEQPSGQAAAQSGAPEANAAPVVIVTGEQQWLLASEDPLAVAELERVLKAIRNPKAEPLVSTGSYSLYLLQRANAVDMQTLLLDLLRSSDGRSSRSSSSDLYRRIKIVADARTNSLVVSGSAAERKVVEELIGVLDSEDLMGGLQQMVPVVLELSSATANQVLNILRDIYRSQLATSGSRRPIAIPEGVSADVATLLQQLNAQSASPLLTITADETTNSLIVRAPPDLSQEIQAFVGSLDQRTADTPSRRVELIRLHSTNAKTLEQALKRLLTK